MSTIRVLVDGTFPGFSKRFRLVRDYWRFSRLKRYKTSFGFDLFGDADLDVSRLSDGEAAIFLHHARRAGTVVDVGANVGFFTCLAASEGLRVIAVEPDSRNLRYLYKNLDINHFEGVEIFPVAISDHPGIGSLLGGGQGATLLPGWGGIKSTYSTRTPVNTLDNLFYDRFKDSSVLIKVDVEGNEFRLLQGAKRLLGKRPAPVWLIEHGLTENFGGACNPFFEDLFKIFTDHGYETFSVGQNLKPVSYDDVSRWVRNKQRDFGGINFLFLRRVD